ncbi:toxin-activating lysine-acyltransferase [Roseibium sp. Sym1]|uniref:toxin-activating lysine-acyltransferase n=1 Tax=Roseibium sp. Sym1 TaxID=3016006 RepID=UPI0022B3C342|nr:toxin-activating lysine-acyltransferase [Roseibium sp. Sym1]
MAPLETPPQVTFAMLGEATALMAESDLHKERSIAEVGGLILPPLMLGQLRIWRRGAMPVALATWAWLDETTEEAVLHRDHVPAPDEWNNGSNPVVIDFIAPFGDGFHVARDLKRTVFPERALRSVRRDAQGHALRIVQHPGLDQSGRPVKARAYAA